MNRVLKLSLTLAIAAVFTMHAQEKKKFKLHTVAFYNLENLFDTINDPEKNDEASPMMELRANRSEIYKKKVHNMARVLSEIGTDLNPNGSSIIGVCEIENQEVLEDVINDPLLVDRGYGIIHYNSPDRRSIDVALLYKKEVFKPTSKSSHELKIYDDSSRKRVYTRDQLLVTGLLEGEEMHFIVNHWPSRSGGEAKSRSKRVAAARLNKKIIDSLQSVNPYAKIITMGDLNDDPTNSSVKDVLEAERNIKKVKFKGIYNPYIDMFKKDGLGTTAYRDAWSLFDQIMLTKPFVEEDYKTFHLYKAGIFNKHYLVNPKGRWKGYPFRSFADGGFSGGFSDHFPVYVHLLKEIE
jgi:exonuclease III